MKEIFKLKKMLEVENIPFEFIERKEVEGYQIGYPKFSTSSKLKECVVSVVQHEFSYGNDVNLLEIWESSKYEPEGYLSAEDVFNRIKTHYKDGKVDEWLKNADGYEATLYA